MKIRIVSLDFYMSNSIPGLDIQYSEFRGASVHHVPVIRIFGSTEEGEKICLHVHGVFPYIYIPYDGQIEVDGFMYQIALGLDKAINISLGQASSNTQHVYKVCLISGIPFYGYHARRHQFLKIYFYNPLIIKKACTLLQNGNILGKIYQPHEAHVPYILQFMIDYNLHGMSFINISDLKYRADEYAIRNYPENMVLPPTVRKMSVCRLEADTKMECILNRDEINSGKLVNPGIKALWDDEKQRRQNNGESSQMEQFLTQNRNNLPQTSTHIAYKKMLDEKLRLKPKLSVISPELELSVYPAETPPDLNLLNASTIDVTSSQNTDDSSILDVTITNESALDEDGQELFDLLQNLKEDNIEKDSILSQTHKKDEEDEVSDIDLSLPLDSNMRTPRKIDDVAVTEYLNDSYFETLGKLPQLDGVSDDFGVVTANRKIKKNKSDGKTNVKVGTANKWNLALDYDLIPNKENINSYYLGNACEMKRRNSKKTFKVKTSAIFCKSKLKFGKTCCLKSQSQRCTKSYCQTVEERTGKVVVEDGQINNVIGRICLGKGLDIGQVVEDICQNLSLKKQSKLRKLSKKVTCSYCPSETHKEEGVVVLDANQNLVGSEENLGRNKRNTNKTKKLKGMTVKFENKVENVVEIKLSKRGRKKGVKKIAEASIMWEKSADLIPEAKTVKNIDKNVNEPLLDMPLLCDSFSNDDIEDNNNNINTTDLNNTSSEIKEEGRYNLRTRKPKPPADLSLTIPKSKRKIRKPKQQKSKQTQTVNAPAAKTKLPRKPLYNIIIKKTQIVDSYKLDVCPIKNKVKSHDYYDLGPNPKPKFRVVAGKKPYTFNLKDTSVKYPNTTWSSYYNPVKNNNDNRITIISDQILESDQKYSKSDIKNGANTDTITLTQPQKKLDRLTSNEERAVTALSDLYDEIRGDIFSQDAAAPLDVPEIFESLRIDNEVTDGATDPSEASLNSISNYREDMRKTYDTLMEKMGKSLNDLFDNIAPIKKEIKIPKKLDLKVKEPQKNVSFNDVCSVRSYNSESWNVFDDIEMEMMEEDTRSIESSEVLKPVRKPLVLIERQLPKLSDLDIIIDSDKSIDGVSVETATKKARTRKSSKENELIVPIYPVNQYTSLDGANDSTSDDDERVKPPVKRRCIQPKKSQSQSRKYSPLKVHYGSPTKSTDLQKQVNHSSISFTDQDKKLQTPQKFKRKLSFSRRNFNKTQSEEKLACVYTSNKKTPLNILPISAPNTAEDDLEEITQNESDFSLITPYQRPCTTTHSQEILSLNSDNSSEGNLENQREELRLSSITEYQNEIDPTNSAKATAETVGDGPEQSGTSLITPYQKPDQKYIKNYNIEFSDSSASLSDDIFSPNLPNSSEIFTFEDRNPAELYDVLHNYIPQAGTSKLTPQQPPPSNKSSDNDVITPYQRETSPPPLSVFEFANQNPPRKGHAQIIPIIAPPSRKSIQTNLSDYNIAQVQHKEAFYSDVKDVTGPVEVGTRVLRILSDKIGDLPEFDSAFRGIDDYRREYLELMYPGDKITNKDVNIYKKSFCKVENCSIRPAELPPTKGEIKSWLKDKLEGDKVRKDEVPDKKKNRIFIPCSPENEDSDDSLTISPCTPIQGDQNIKGKNHDSCRITGATLADDFAISYDNLQDARTVSEYLNLTLICMELIIETRGGFNPDPAHDTIKGIVYKIFNDVPEGDPHRKRSMRGCFLLDTLNASPTTKNFKILDGIILERDDVIEIVKTESELLNKFVEFFTESDPDILIGYEIEMLSWGYLIERGYILNLNLIPLLSRVRISPKNKPEDGQPELTIPGRIILDFWRLLRHEIALQSYTFESIAYHVLHRRVPAFSFKTLTNWWNYPSGLYRNRVLRYYYDRIDSILEIIARLDLIGRTSELAKLFGIQFYEVLSRGSQFRVESMMLRLAKPQDYIAVSPSVQQRAKMRAPEFLPLIMEPESKFYVDPVIVLDFQSLYPSMIIAYNYCFSTCLGRVEHLGENVPFEFGATQLKIPRKYVKNLARKDLINISPCGVAYVKKSVREGILPRMLQEILDTRLMVKKSLKKNAGNKTLVKVLDARQLGLKLIANVTYGYTAANFSGRMPCIEVADSVVSKGRETLQRAINLVERTAEWGARVVYGDTDSLFVLIAGRSREEAFRIGAKIAEAVTEDNPSPVRLKLEKIFHPCILQTKKRYVGYMFESPEQVEPEYCAKGIETVRRDGCPAVSKMLEKCLKILFDTRDVSLVRQYVVRQFSKILTGRISIQDLTFAKEYRGASNYRPGACVPALELARKWVAQDKRSEPRRKERVPYVIINGPPGLPLIKLVRSPRELIADPSLRPNALYYITKVIIPPINRCFLLIGADVNNWFNEMPRKQYTSYQHNSSPVKGKKSTISQYFSTRNCVICSKQSKDGLCDSCLVKPQGTSAILHERIRVLEQNYFCVKKICELCCSASDKLMCISLDCPVYYKRVQVNKEIEQTPFFRELIAMLPCLDF